MSKYINILYEFVFSVENIDSHRTITDKEN